MASLLSILKNVINLNRVHVEKSEIVTVPERHFGEIYEEKRIYIWLRPIRRYQSRCPICGKKCHGYDYRSEEESWWRASNLNGIPVYLFYRRQRIECAEHGVHAEWIPWADGESRFTESFNNEVAWMALQMSKLAVSILMGINWRTVGNCIKAAHNRIEPDVSVRLHGLRRICVDETSYRKGHTYITVVYDMERNQVEFVHQEIFARLTMYNFYQLIAQSVVIQQNSKKYAYKVNFFAAVHICRQFFLGEIPPPLVEALLTKHISPIRPGRSRPRKPKPKQALSFLYRVA